MNSAELSNPPSFLQFCSAHCPSLNIMCNRPSFERQPLERLVRGRMVAKADLIGLLSWDALPMLGREVEELHEFLAIFLQAPRCFGVFDFISFEEQIKHLFRISFSLGLPDVVDCGLSF